VLSGSDAAWGSPELHALRMQLEDSLRAIPGAAAASVSLSLPRANNGFGMVQLEGGDGPEDLRSIRVQSADVGPGFFETLDVAPTRGRTFSAADASPGARPVVMVSERFATAVLSGGSPLGLRLRWARESGDPTDWIEIVGVVPDLGMDPGDLSAHGEVYSPMVGTNFMYAAVRADADPLSIAPALQRAVATVDSSIRVTDIQRLSEVGWEARIALGAGGTALMALGGMALLLSLAGIYALASLVVTMRTREIGIRVALGASKRSVLRAVMTGSVMQLVGGTLGGLALALLSQRVIQVLPFAIPGRLTLAVPALAAVMLLAGLMASWVPARRALGVDPVQALRRE